VVAAERTKKGNEGGYLLKETRGNEESQGTGGKRKATAHNGEKTFRVDGVPRITSRNRERPSVKGARWFIGSLPHGNPISRKKKKQQSDTKEKMVFGKKS